MDSTMCSGCLIYVYAPRTIEMLIAGGSAPAPWVTFLCTRKEKSPKESAPPGRRPPTPRVSSRRAGLRGCADATSLSRRRTLAIPRSPLRAYASATRGARLDQRGLEKTSVPWSEVGCSSPRSARRVPQVHRELLSETVFEPEARSLCPASWSSARWGEERRKFSRAPGCVSFGYFSLHKQRKVTCRGSATHK